MAHAFNYHSYLYNVVNNKFRNTCLSKTHMKPHISCYRVLKGTIYTHTHTHHTHISTAHTTHMHKHTPHTHTCTHTHTIHTIHHTCTNKFGQTSATTLPFLHFLVTYVAHSGGFLDSKMWQGNSLAGASGAHTPATVTTVMLHNIQHHQERMDTSVWVNSRHITASKQKLIFY